MVWVNASMQDSEGRVSAFRRKGGKRRQERKQAEGVSSDAASFRVGAEFSPGSLHIDVRCEMSHWQVKKRCFLDMLFF